MAASRVELNVHPYGLGGGYILSGSVSASFTDAFQYYPVVTTSAIIKLEIPQNGAGVSAFTTTGNISSSTWTVGVPIYGPVTHVTQSSGIAFVYNGVAANPPRL